MILGFFYEISIYNWISDYYLLNVLELHYIDHEIQEKNHEEENKFDKWIRFIRT